VQLKSVDREQHTGQDRSLQTLFLGLKM